MSIIDKIKSVFGAGNTEVPSPETEFVQMVDNAWKEYKGAHQYFWNVNLNETQTWTNVVKNWSDKKKVNFILWLVEEIHAYMRGKRNWSSVDEKEQHHSIRQAFLLALFRNKLIMSDSDIENVFAAFCNRRADDWSSFTSWPIGPFINQIERQRKDQPITAALKTVLEKLKTEIDAVKGSYQEKDRIKMVDKIDSVLFRKDNDEGAIKPARFLGEDQFADFVNPVIESMSPADRVFWYKLLPLAQKATGSKPSQKYLDVTHAMVKEYGPDKFKKTIYEWLQFVIDMKEREQRETFTYLGGQSYEYVTYEFLTTVNAEAVKGLIWVCAHFHDKATIQLISNLAERSYRKIPSKGPAAPSVGNACLYVLYKSKGLDGIGRLSRLKLRIKQANTQSAIDKYLLAAAEKQGVTVSEIEDMAVDDLGLINGARSFEVDEYTACLIVTGVGKTEVKWFRPNGTEQKSVPAVIKEKFAAKLKKIKDTAKQVEQTLTAQRDRIDRMFRVGRSISYANFGEYYLGHGLMSYLAHRIIWNFHYPDGQVRPAIYLNNCWVNDANEIVVIEGADSVSLWHPVQSTVAGIAAWREFLIFHQLQQPLKQAFREVYLLTDAEVNTRLYSNRMAAHLLRQHQFNSLAKTRGWRYALMGAFDNGGNDKASLLLPESNLRAEYWINEVNADGATNDTGIWNYISTDQVRFLDIATNETRALVDVPPLVFSEVMRDVDLFVGVASVGNDPTWRDSGGLVAYRDYWTSYSFGELTEVAKNRKEIITRLIPRLKIKDVATVKDKFVVVKGKLRTYKIHLGSTNILMEPNDQYLCIVPDRNQKNPTENVFLPFEGDNGLSIILSKAFLLAADDKITDATIISQLAMR